MTPPSLDSSETVPRWITQEELNKAQRFGNLCPDKVADSTIVKFGDCIRFAGAEAMRLVRKHTDIQYPRYLMHIEMNKRATFASSWN
jgi:hypothetical protein